MPKQRRITRRRSPYLTPAGERVLRLMIATDEELVCEGLRAYVGDEPTHPRIAYKLLQFCLIKSAGYTHDRSSIQYYVPTPDAARVLADPDYTPAVVEAMRTGKPVVR